MPSLRRSYSSPLVRSAPYPASSSQVASRVHGHGHRRSSGSETSNRRVLADIEWWKVAGGQRDLDAEQEPHDRVDQARNIPDITGPPSEDARTERPTTPLSWAASSSLEPLHVLPAPSLATLGVVPQTPTRRGHTFETSSVESSPQLSSIERLRRDLADLNLGYAVPMEHNLLPSLRRIRPPPPLIPSLSLGDSLLFGDPVGQYADFTISPLSSNTPSFMN